jgi:hypothetical protein
MLLTQQAAALLAAELVKARRVQESAAAYVKISMLMSVAQRLGMDEIDVNALRVVRRSRRRCCERSG